MGQLNIYSSAQVGHPTTQTPYAFVPTSKVNFVQSTFNKNPQKLGGKKNNKSKTSYGE